MKVTCVTEDKIEIEIDMATVRQVLPTGKNSCKIEHQTDNKLTWTTVAHSSGTVMRAVLNCAE